jgi:hypothetical protein
MADKSLLAEIDELLKEPIAGECYMVAMTWWRSWREQQGGACGYIDNQELV